MCRKLAVFILLLLVVWPVAIFAQDAELTCDEALTEAQTAYDNDKDTAWDEAAKAETLCFDDPDQFSEAQRLRQRSQGIAINWAINAEPGTVDVDDTHSVSMVCIGEGSPTVIFEHGGMGNWAQWVDVQPAVSTITQTCSYTRASPVGDEVRTTQDQVDDLIALLDIAEIEPPYILVGYSVAGLNITLLAGQHPELVAGIVLVEATHPDFWKQAVENPSWLEGHFTPAWLGVSDNFDMLASSEQAAMYDDFGDIPLVVYTYPNFPLGEGAPVFLELNEDFASWSTNSHHIIDEDFTYYTANTSRIAPPEVLIEEILWVLDEARAAED